MIRTTHVTFVLAAALLVACAPKPAAAPAAGQVDLARLQGADSEPDNWLASGRDLGKTHYSPLQAINRETVGTLGFAWEYQTGTNRGMQATPVVVDGVMYVSAMGGRVYALDAATGAAKWTFEPQQDLRNVRGACCDIVNRGVAVWQGRVYVAGFSGALYALDAQDGHIVWQTDTFQDRSRAYSITGAPVIAGKVVVIGNGGAEYDSRGYISGYDLQTGKQVWRFYTVPGDPSKPQESKALEMALPTWKGDKWWERGGGGNPWDAISYDPETNLVYFGTANGAPWSRGQRSAGEGDNLYLSSIVAVNADTGDYAWHYQTTPGERWDYDATPHIMLATLKLGGVDRKVLMQASKNGFFYVLDRKSGELLSADPFVATTWASKVDLKTGRPVENTALADYSDGPKLLFPSAVGGHNFNPMSLSPRTGLVYIPSVHSGMVMAENPLPPHKRERIGTGVQVAFSFQLAAPQSLPPSMRKLADPAFLKTQPDIAMSASLKAWDPVSRKVVWEFKNSSFMDHGGVLSTAGGLVVQGGLDGKLKVLNDQTGELIKEIDVGTAMIAAPMTYRVKGEQYLAITAGTGGGGWNFWFPENIAFTNGNANRILAFKLGGGATPKPEPLPPVQPLPEPPAQVGTTSDIAAGAKLFAANCGSCHGNAPRSPVPDLRRSGVVRDGAAFQQVVRGGSLTARGMPAWDDLLTEAEVTQIHAYVVSTAREGYAVEQKASAKPAASQREGTSQGHL